MQQTPAQTHTLDTLRAALVQHKPQLEPIIDTVFSKFRETTTPSDEIAEQLKTMLKRDITPGENEDARTFTWRNPSNQPIVLTIPLEDQGDEPTAEATDQADTVEESGDEEAAVEGAAVEQAADEESAPEEDAVGTEEATAEPTNNQPENDNTVSAEPERINLLDDLDTLLDNTHLHLIIQRTGKKDGQNVLSVTVIPQAKDDKTDPALLTPINLKGTTRELETGLLQAIRITTDGNRSIEEALAELEEAKKEAAAAKKAEASKTKKGTSKAAPKAAAAKKDEKPAEPEAPSLFDAPAEDTKATKNTPSADAANETAEATK